jgi:RimJ/RimL family protein N-acetyltransferase
MNFIETERLVLRNFRDEDIDELYDYRNDTRSTKYQLGLFSTRESLERLIARRKDDPFPPREHRQYAIALREGDVLIGDVSVNVNDTTISLGYTVSYKHQRQGYAYEILSALIARLHEIFPMHEVICLTERENEASGALLNKLGFADMGFSPEMASEVFGLWVREEQIYL